MDMHELEKALAIYERSVRFPDVSGMEHLDMLLTRSEIEQNSHMLDSDQKERVSSADKLLLIGQDKFFKAIEKIADLEKWRQHHDVPVSHWWWYLDVLSYFWPHLENHSSLTLSSLELNL